VLRIEVAHLDFSILRTQEDLERGHHLPDSLVETRDAIGAPGTLVSAALPALHRVKLTCRGRRQYGHGQARDALSFCGARTRAFLPVVTETAGTVVPPHRRLRPGPRRSNLTEQPGTSLPESGDVRTLAARIRTSDADLGERAEASTPGEPQEHAAHRAERTDEMVDLVDEVDHFPSAPHGDVKNRNPDSSYASTRKHIH
jgi:hypothetical protein